MPSTTTATYQPQTTTGSAFYRPRPADSIYAGLPAFDDEMAAGYTSQTALPSQPYTPPGQPSVYVPPTQTPPPPARPGYETGVTSVIGTPVPGTTTPLSAAGNTGPASNETTTAGMQNLVRDSILNILSQPSPTAQDAQLQPAISAYNAAQNRATARQVAQNAEAFGASGLESSGARLAADQGVIEQQGLNEGAFAANAVLSELESRRQRAMQALSMASAINDQDLSRRLQEQLAQLNAAIQRESLAQTGRLGDADIALREKLGMGNLNLGVLGLAQQGRQFNDSLGFNLAQLEATLNNQALVNLLYGGR